MKPDISENVSKKITVLNLVLTFFIVFSHWTSFYPLTAFGKASAVGDALTEIFSVLGIVSLATFFMLSGYLFYRNLDTLEDLRGKAVRRLLMLGVPFVFWNVIYLLYNIAYGLYKGNLDINGIDVLLGFTLNPFNSPMWYLLALLVLMALSPLVMTLKKHPHISGVAVVLVFFTAMLISVLTESGGIVWNWIRRLISYLPLYFIGAFLGMHADETVREEKFFNKNYSILSAVVFVAIIATMVVIDVPAPFKWLFYQLTPVLLWISVPAKIFTRVTPCLALSVAPFIYASHSLAILVLNSIWTQKLFSAIDFPTGVDIIFHILLAAMLYFACLGAAWLLKKILPEKIYQIFAGGSAGRKMY